MRLAALRAMQKDQGDARLSADPTSAFHPSDKSVDGQFLGRMSGKSIVMSRMESMAHTRQESSGRDAQFVQDDIDDGTQERWKTTAQLNGAGLRAELEHALDPDTWLSQSDLISPAIAAGVHGGILDASSTWSDGCDTFVDAESSSEGVYGEGQLLVEKKMQAMLLRQKQRQTVDRFAQVIDDERLRELAQLKGYNQRAREIRAAAEQLVAKIGIQNVVLLQLTSYTYIDHAGVLRGFVLVVRKSAPVKPILETMADYGSGRMVFSGINRPRRTKSGGEFDTELASETLRGLIASRSVLDFSDPANEPERRAAHAFLQAIRENGGDRLQVIPTNMGNVQVLEDANLLADSDAIAERKRASRFVSLGQHNTSVALCRYSEDVTVVCENYAQTTADMIQHSLQMNMFASVGEFLASPLSHMAREHSRVARSAVIAKVVEQVETQPLSGSFIRPESVSYGATKDVQDDAWHFDVETLEQVAVDDIHCYIRPLSSDAEWQKTRMHCLDMMDALSGDFEENSERRAMLETPTRSDFAVVFNGVTDPAYINRNYTKNDSRRPGFTFDLGPSAEIHVLYNNRGALELEDTMLGIPHAALFPQNAAMLAELLTKDKRQKHLGLVGHSSEYDQLEILPLQISGLHSWHKLQRMFRNTDIADSAMILKYLMALHDLLRDQFTRSVSLGQLDQPETHVVLFRWRSSVDPSLLTLAKRRSMIGPMGEILIDVRHKQQLRELFELLIENLDKVERSDPLLNQLQTMIRPGTSSVNPDGVVLSLSSELTDRLLQGWNRIPQSRF